MNSTSIPRTTIIFVHSNSEEPRFSSVEKAIEKINENSIKSITFLTDTIDETTAQELAKALVNNTSIEKLELFSNRIGDQGAQALALALVNNTSLKKLNLSHNQIAELGAQEFSMVLKNNTSLKSLDLSSNSLSDLGIKVLSDSLAKNSSLTMLNLANNKIGKLGIQAIAEFLTSNTTLRQLDLNSNKIEEEDATIIAQALVHNSSLDTLKLGRNHFSFLETQAMPSTPFAKKTEQQFKPKKGKIFKTRENRNSGPIYQENKAMSYNNNNDFISEISLGELFFILKKNTTLTELNCVPPKSLRHEDSENYSKLERIQSSINKKNQQKELLTSKAASVLKILVETAPSALPLPTEIANLITKQLLITEPDAATLRRIGDLV